MARLQGALQAREASGPAEGGTSLCTARGVGAGGPREVRGVAPVGWGG